TNKSDYSSTLKDFNVDNINFDMNSSDKMSSLPKIGGNKGEFNNSIKSQYTMNGIIQFKTKYGTSLKAALDGLDQIVEYDENLSLDNNEDNINNSNIFKKTKKDEDREGYFQSLEEINKFNLSIVKNSQWGHNTAKGHNYDKPENKTYFKP